jgi:hypothetical protein
MIATQTLLCIQISARRRLGASTDLTESVLAADLSIGSLKSASAAYRLATTPACPPSERKATGPDAVAERGTPGNTYGSAPMRLQTVLY